MTLTLASWHFLTASFTPSLKEFFIPNTAKNTKSFWPISLPYESSFSLFSYSFYSFSFISLYAIYKFLNLSLLKSSIDCFICIETLSSKEFFWPILGLM